MNVLLSGLVYDTGPRSFRNADPTPKIRPLIPSQIRTNQPAHSRRLGVYKVAALSMKCYFKVDRPSLCKNLIRATASDASIPPLDSGTFPMADRVTWRYFVGLLGFLNGDEASAEENLSWAFDNCHANAYRNQE